MIYISTVLCGILVFVSSVKVPFRDCGSNGTVIHSVEVSPCVSDPCAVLKGIPVTYTFTFTATENITAGDPSILIDAGSGYVQRVLEKGTVCDGLTPDCPIVAKKTYVYTVSNTPQDYLPEVVAGIKYVLWHVVGYSFFCAEFFVTIVPSEIYHPDI